MTSEYEDLSLRLMRTVMDGAPPSEIKKAAREAKRQIWSQWVQFVREAQVIDSIVTKYAYDPAWQWGVQNPDAPPPPTALTVGRPPSTGLTPAAKRKERILELANRALQEGERIVKTAAIAEQLQREGDTINIRNLMTSVGNTLSRNGWRRIRDGEYESARSDEEDAFKSG